MMKPVESLTVRSKGAIWLQHAHDKDKKVGHCGSLTYANCNALLCEPAQRLP